MSWEAFVSDQMICVETEFEAKLMKAVKNLEEPSRAFGKPIDLLEVYAQPNSKLAEEVTLQGGKAARFTREHGDLETFEGKVQLLRMVCRLRPKHIWVAPECHPWCARNRFNSGRSTRLFERIQRDQELSKVVRVDLQDSGTTKKTLRNREPRRVRYMETKGVGKCFLINADSV